MSGQTWNPGRYAKNARFVAELGMPVVELLAPQPGERILDLGCGDGALTEKLVEFGCDVVAVDASAEQIKASRKRGLDARVADVRRLEFDVEFDAVFTNAVLHWVKQADEVIDGVRRALVKPGGRFVGEFGGAGNVARIVAALANALSARGVDIDQVNPWYFPSAVEYGDKLRAHGFRVRSIELIPRPTPLPNDIVCWLETFGESFTAAIPLGDRDTFRDEVQELLRTDLCDTDGTWTVDYVRLRFAAELDVSS
jgi:trans-aconitate methyltransferase